MRRKIVQQGTGTLTISLPSSWARKLGLATGDELDLVERDNILEVISKKHRERQKVKIDAWGFDYFFLLYKVRISYIFGANTIEIDNPNKEILQKIHELNSKFIGFRITRQTEKGITFEEVTSLNDENYGNTFKKLIELLKDTTTIEFEAKHNKSMIEYKTDNTNAFLYLCQRHINTKTENDISENQKQSLILNSVENILDEVFSTIEVIEDKENHNKYLKMLERQLEVLPIDDKKIKNTAEKLSKTTKFTKETHIEISIKKIQKEIEKIIALN